KQMGIKKDFQTSERIRSQCVDWNRRAVRLRQSGGMISWVACKGGGGKGAKKRTGLWRLRRGSLSLEAGSNRYGNDQRRKGTNAHSNRLRGGCCSRDRGRRKLRMAFDRLTKYLPVSSRLKTG